MGTTIIGFTLLLLGAICGGSFGLPSKFVKKETPWETLWGPFFFFVTILIPVTVFPFVADGLFAICREAGVAAIAGPVLFGILWGFGSMTLGLSFAFIGLSLAYALNYGAQIAVGFMGPMLIHHPDQLLTTHGFVIIAGVAVCLVGVVVSGRAGVLKTRSQEGGDAQEEAGTEADSGTIRKGMAIAFVSGILCGCYSIAFSFGGGVSGIAEGAPYLNAPWRGAFVVSALILWGGSLSACGYCVFKLCKNRSWGSLAAPGVSRVLFIALIMACLHNGAILFFGIGASKLGDLGVGIGYAVFMSFAIIVGNVNGFLTGEWKGASSQSKTWIAAGIAVLIVGVCILAYGNTLT